MENGWSVTLISEDRHCFRYLLLLMSIPFIHDFDQVPLARAAD